MSKTNSRTGVTLIELLIVLTLAAILTTIAVPGMATVVRSVRLNTAAQSYAADLRLARIEAIKRNRRISVVRTGARSYTITRVGNRELAEGAAFTNASADSISFASFGPAIPGSARFVIEASGAVRTIEVNAAGFATVRQ